MSVVGKSEHKRETNNQNEHLRVKQCFQQQSTAQGHAMSTSAVCGCCNVLLLNTSQLRTHE